MEERKFIVMFHTTDSYGIRDYVSLGLQLYTLEEIESMHNETCFRCTELEDCERVYNTREDVCKAIREEYEGDEELIKHLIDNWVVEECCYLMEVYELFPNGEIKRALEYCTY